jgi:phage terminase small subunit
LNKQDAKKQRKQHRRELTAKQRALVKALAKTMHLGKAAIEAGYSLKYATSSANQALE